MGSPRQINETLVANVALLAGGTCCLLGGPAAVGLFGVLAAPAVGIGGWGLAKWFKRFQDKNPKSHKAIRPTARPLRRACSRNRPSSPMPNGF